MERTFLEFFAGGGMARAGLGAGWRCLFANDIDAIKAAAYRANWGGAELAVGDVGALTLAHLPAVRADLAWASFPCQDLSLAGDRAGMAGARSGAFLPFWRQILGLRALDRAPRLIAIENVTGLLSSHGGRDFAELCRMLRSGGYRFGALVMDALDFLPQSRPRLFVVAIDRDLPLPAGVVVGGPDAHWHPPRLRAAWSALASDLKDAWLWFAPAIPPRRTARLIDLIEDAPTGVAWHSEAQTGRLLTLMTALNRAKVAAALASGARMVGTVYRRTRPDPGGGRVQRAEVRFDDVAGCLRTPAGGSSRQTILLVEGGQVRSRLLSARETARLMGLSDDYRLPARYNDAYHLTGDGVAVPVVRWLAREVLEPALAAGVGLHRRAA
jgi:DNA (cytosine-5)-methyltransferase 1